MESGKMDINFAYPVRFVRARGGWVITCRDLPEVISQAEEEENRIDVAEGALQAAFESRIVLKEPVPAPSPKRAGEEVVTVPVETARKAASTSPVNRRRSQATGAKRVRR